MLIKHLFRNSVQYIRCAQCARTYCDSAVAVSSTKSVTKPSARQYFVSPYCDINALLPFHTEIKPIDLNEFPNNDRVIIHCDQPVEATTMLDSLTNSLHIKSPHGVFDEKTKCLIEAPISAKFNIVSTGDISVSKFVGDAVRLCSEKGNIQMESCHNKDISIRANLGDITLKETVEGKKIHLQTVKGNISANKIKCLGLHLETSEGTVNTESAYCDESLFTTKSGILNLYNVHKFSKIMTINGAVNIVGFDGTLEVTMHTGKADIHLSRLTGKMSKLIIHEEGELNLRLSETVLKDAEIHINCKQSRIDESISYEEDNNIIEREVIKIIPKKINTKLIIECPKSVVNVTQASWMEMMQKKLAKN